MQTRDILAPLAAALCVHGLHWLIKDLVNLPNVSDIPRLDGLITALLITHSAMLM